MDLRALVLPAVGLREADVVEGEAEKAALWSSRSLSSDG